MSRYMNFREGKKVSWQEMLTIGLALFSIILALMIIALDGFSAPTNWLAIAWALSGVAYVLTIQSNKRLLVLIFLGYASLWSFMPSAFIYAILGFVLGTILSYYIGKD